MAAYKSPIQGLPDEHMRMVGIIAAHWEWVEVLLERALAEIMELQHQRVGLLTQHITFSTKCDLVLVYARHLEKVEPEAWKQFKQAIQELREAYGARNEYIHAQWSPPDDDVKEWRIASVRTRGGKLVANHDVVPIENLYGAATKIWNAGVAFGLLCQTRGLLAIR